MIEPKDEFIIAGDWHGSPGQACQVIDYAGRNNIDTIVHAGDFGIWNGDERFLTKVQRRLESKGARIYFIDGNHENFPRLYEYPIIGDGTRQVRDNIFHIPRGHRWCWNGITFMGLGGAPSIDVMHREEGKTWWPEELITEEDVQKAIAPGPVDVMITHDSPYGAPNSITDDVYGQAMARKYYGADIVDQCTDHRRLLRRVTDAVIPRMLFHGHYHKYMAGSYYHEEGQHAIVIGLDQGQGPLTTHHTYRFKFEDEHEELRSMHLLDIK